MVDYARREKIFLVLASAFVVVLVLTNVIGVKLFQAPFNPEFALTTGILTYPLTFLITDIVSEVYGKKRADFMVAVGFGMSVLMMAILMVAVAVPPHDYWVAPVNPYYADAAGYQHAYTSVFALNGILLFGSMSAFLCAQLTDNWLFHRLRRLTGGRHLWLRNNGSTWISQLVDTIVVNSILFYIGFGMDFMVGVEIMVTIYLYKVAIAAMDTPFVYLGIWVLGKLGVKPAPISA
jgi:uncharacterized integral membrane protein (TIGR00697 family)